MRHFAHLFSFFTRAPSPNGPTTFRLPSYASVYTHDCPNKTSIKVSNDV